MHYTHLKVKIDQLQSLTESQPTESYHFPTTRACFYIISREGRCFQYKNLQDQYPPLTKPRVVSHIHSLIFTTAKGMEKLVHADCAKNFKTCMLTMENEKDPQCHKGATLTQKPSFEKAIQHSHTVLALKSHNIPTITQALSRPSPLPSNQPPTPSTPESLTSSTAHSDQNYLN